MATVTNIQKRAKNKTVKQIEDVINSFDKNVSPKTLKAWTDALNKKKEKYTNTIIAVDPKRFESTDDAVVKKYKALKRSAEKRGKDFNLSLSDVKKLISRKTCAYTGIRLTYEGDNSPTKATIDRFDSRLGYVKGNVFTVCSAANSLKEMLFESGCSRSMNIKQLQRFCKTMTDMGIDKV